MELPDNLKSLYRHWAKHTALKPATPQQLRVDPIYSEIAEFVSERMRIWEKKLSGLQPPYTADPILAQYRFCNIYRELDRQTIQIHTLLNPVRAQFEHWLLNLAFNRFLCRPDTYQNVGSLSFNESANQLVYENLMKLKPPRYGNAYVFPISVIQRSQTPTRELFFTQYLPAKIPEVARMIKGFNEIGVVDALEQLLPVFGFNFRFHWTEILIDVAYQFPDLIDLNKRFPIGPGSLPTMKKFDLSAHPEQVCLELSRYELPGFRYLTYEGKKVQLSAENWEGIGCEFRKFCNLKVGKGRVRRYSSQNSQKSSSPPAAPQP